MRPFSRTPSNATDYHHTTGDLDAPCDHVAPAKPKVPDPRELEIDVFGVEVGPSGPERRKTMSLKDLTSTKTGTAFLIAAVVGACIVAGFLFL